MTAHRPLLPQKDIARLVAPAVCRAPALTALAGGFVVVPGEALGLATGIITFILVRIALDDLLDRLT